MNPSVYKNNPLNSNPMFSYYSLSAINNDQNRQSKQVLRFVDTRNSPYLMNPAYYHLSIIRFSVQTSDVLPIFIPQALLGQNNPNKLIYEITMINSGSTGQTENITYIPSNALASINPPISNIDLTNDYYYVYTMQQWVKMINATIATLCTSLTIARCFFNYNISSGLLEFYVPTSWTTEKIYFNESFKTLMLSFPYIYEYDVVMGQNAWRLDWSNNNNLNVVVINSVNYYKIEQENSSLSVLNPVKSIVFESSLLPVLPSNGSKPIVFGSSVTHFGNGNNSSISSEITDIQISPSKDNNYQGSVLYIPTAEYRLFDLTSSPPLSSIEISVYWKDQFNNNHPVLIPPGMSCDLKLLFRRKDFDNQTIE